MSEEERAVVMELIAELRAHKKKAMDRWHDAPKDERRVIVKDVMSDNEMIEKLENSLK